MIDSQLLGETAARCMESLDIHESLDGGKILAVGIVVVAENSDADETFTRVFCSETVYYRQIGLMKAGLECAEDGYRVGPPGGEDEDEE